MKDAHGREGKAGQAQVSLGTRGWEWRDPDVTMKGVREHMEDMAVDLDTHNDRLVVVAYNEAGFNRTAVDLLDLITWLRLNRPGLLTSKKK